MDRNETVRTLARQYQPYVVDCRRRVHTIAEVCAQEVKTHAFILEEVKKLGLPYEEVPTTNLIVKLDTGRPGPVLALRADIDALPVAEEENNLKGPRTCRSEQPNTCHACGHDAHTAMLLGAMHVLTDMREELTGTVLFCFEEGEETGTGVAALLEALEKYQVDKVWAIHVYAGLEENKICVDPGPRMAGAAGTKLTFIGKSGHGSRPDLAVNPVFCAASFLNDLSVAFSNQVTAGQTVTMGITMLHAGEATNVIAERAELAGSFRFFDQEEGQRAVERFKTIAQHAAEMHKCRVEFDGQTRVLTIPVINDPQCAELARKALTEILPEGAVVSCEPWYASDSMNRWLKKYPGVYAHLGILNEAEGYGALHHNGKFDLNEKVMETGVTATARYALEILGKK